jgi:glyoxylase-like metal-dependent hydrolase (beta-lactamase superfamily II)
MKNRLACKLVFIAANLTGTGMLCAADSQPNSASKAQQTASGAIRVNHIDVDFEMDQLAPNIYAFVANNTTHDWEDGNTTVIIGEDAVAVVDAPSTYLSKRHLAQIRKLTNKPIRYLINTHFHRDHVMGNHVYQDAYPDLTVIQQEYTATIANRRDPLAIGDLKGKGGDEQLRALKEAAEKGVDAKGTPLVGYDLERAKRSYKEFLPVYREAKGARYVPANVTFETSMTINLGACEIRLMHLAGHTPGDTIVWIPKSNILIAGDLVIAPVPFGGPDQYLEWIASLDKLITFDASAIVPGHGPVEFTQEYMAQERDLFKALMDQAVTAVNQGRSFEEFKKMLDLTAFEAKFVHGDPELQWGWDNYFVGKNGALAARAYRTAFGAL